MNQFQKIAVIGGGGRTGSYLVKQLVNEGYQVKVLIRNLDDLQIQNQSIEIIKGDALMQNAIDELLCGCQCVLSTIGQRQGEPLVAEQVTKNLLAAMAKYRIMRYISVAGINIDTPFDEKGIQTMQATNWMKANYPVIQADRQKAYSLLASSSVDWTLVRVPFITFSDAAGKIIVDLKDCQGNKIIAGNIAKFMIQQLYEDNYLREAPFISDL